MLGILPQRRQFVVLEFTPRVASANARIAGPRSRHGAAAEPKVRAVAESRSRLGEGGAAGNAAMGEPTSWHGSIHLGMSSNPPCFEQGNAHDAGFRSARPSANNERHMRMSFTGKTTSSGARLAAFASRVNDESRNARTCAERPKGAEPETLTVRRTPPFIRLISHGCIGIHIASRFNTCSEPNHSRAVATT